MCFAQQQIIYIDSEREIDSESERDIDSESDFDSDMDIEELCVSQSTCANHFLFSCYACCDGENNAAKHVNLQLAAFYIATARVV